jgi:hypothetical protein
MHKSSKERDGSMKKSFLFLTAGAFLLSQSAYTSATKASSSRNCPTLTLESDVIKNKFWLEQPEKITIDGKVWYTRPRLRIGPTPTQYNPRITYDTPPFVALSEQASHPNECKYEFWGGLNGQTPTRPVLNQIAAFFILSEQELKAPADKTIPPFKNEPINIGYVSQVCPNLTLDLNAVASRAIAQVGQKFNFDNVVWFVSSKRDELEGERAVDHPSIVYFSSGARNDIECHYRYFNGHNYEVDFFLKREGFDPNEMIAQNKKFEEKIIQFLREAQKKYPLLKIPYTNYAKQKFEAYGKALEGKGFP